jgi:hypothetical protein
MKKPSHLTALALISFTGINENTFYKRAIDRKIDYIQPFRGSKHYSVKDWELKNPDYKVAIDKLQ